MSNCITVNINPCIPIQPSTTPDAWLSTLPVALNDQAAIAYYQSLTPRKSGLLGYVVAQGSDVEPQGAMRRVMVPVISFLLLLCSVGLSAQAIVRTVGITYTNGTPTHTPSPQASWVALDTVSRNFFEYSNGVWVGMGERLQSISGCASPAYTPTKAQSTFVINACDSMYVYRTSAWRHVNKGGGGGGVTDGDKGDIDVTSSGTVWTVDTSAISTNKITNAAVTWAKLAQAVKDSITAGGGITGSGVSGRIPIFNGTSSVTSDADLKYTNDTLLIGSGRLKFDSENGDSKIIIDNRKPFVYGGGSVTVSDKIIEVLQPVNRSVATQDTTPPISFWHDYTKYQSGQTGNHILGFGPNFGNGIQRIIPNFPAVGITMENWYQPNVGGDGLSEFITSWIPRTGSVNRPFAWYGNNTSNTIDVIVRSNVFSVFNWTSGLEVLNNSGGTFLFKGSKATGVDARVNIRFADQRNLTKISSIVADTSEMAIAARKFLTFGLYDATGWIAFNNRLAETKLLFGRTTPSVLGRPFFETQDDGFGLYKSGGTILLGNYSCLGSRVNNGYGGVGSSYYLDNSGVLKNASGDVASGIYFEANKWLFWNSPAVTANTAITATVRATIDASGRMALGTTALPSVSLDVVGTDGIKTPSGTTGQRPSAVGVIRNNTTTSAGEMSVDSAGVTVWRTITNRVAPGGGTAQIQYNNTGAFDGADSIVIIESGGDRMGVGRINPTARLHVQATGISGSVDALRVDNSSGNPLFEVENGGKTIAVGQVQIGGALMPNNNAGTAGQVLVSQGSLTFPVWRTDTLHLAIALSDETLNLTTGPAKVTFRAPVAMNITGVRASVNTAPVGSTIIVDVNEAGASIFSTRLSIDSSEKTSVTAAVPPVFSDTAIANDAEITVDIDQIGSSTAGRGLKITLYYTK